MDALTDLYDEEIARIGPIWKRLNEEFRAKTANSRNMEELQKRVHEEFFKIGLVARVDFPTYVAEGGDGEPVFGAPAIEIQGRVPGAKLASSDDGVQVLDHERKRSEVLMSKERGEKFLGQKETHPALRPK